VAEDVVIAAVWLTAIGTIAVALVAVGVALWGDRQTAKRVQAEHDRADRRLADERTRHDHELASERDRRDKELADERAHSARQLEAAQTFSRNQIAEEHRLSQEREQLAYAHAIQVVRAEHQAPAPARAAAGSSGNMGTRVLTAIVVNHGNYTIVRVECQFHLGASGNVSYVVADKTEWMSGYYQLEERLRAGLDGPPDHNPYMTTLAPWGIGIRFQTDRVAAKFAPGWYPVVRWTDRWGTRWEHKLGEVRQIDESAIWEP
jgi:hypothetical protein